MQEIAQSRLSIIIIIVKSSKQSIELLKLFIAQAPIIIRIHTNYLLRTIPRIATISRQTARSTPYKDTSSVTETPLR